MQNKRKHKYVLGFTIKKWRRVQSMYGPNMRRLEN